MRHRLPLRFAVSVCLLMLLLAPAVSAEPVDFGERESPMRVYWLNGRLVVGVYPQANEGYIQMARRVMAQPEDYPRIAELNRNQPVMTGRPVVFPIAMLQPALWGQALHAMYPDDELTERGWAHTVTDPLESLSQLIEAYTGSQRRTKELASYNKLRNPDVLRIGDEIVVPLHWIPDELGFRPVAVSGPLKLEKDAQTGKLYAVYELAPNDTLYSLLLRFTDRERAEELNRMSRLLVKLNGLRSETQLWVGRPLRIPLEWVSEEHLVAARPPVQRLTPPPPAPPKRSSKPFEPIHVIVDAGHGGNDPGAVYGARHAADRVYEHEVVYDVSRRLVSRLEDKGYAVYPTTEDRARQYPMRTLSTKALGREEVRVTPPYRMVSARVAVNMRVFFINSLFRELTRHRGVPPEHVVLVSIHGDALAPTLRGAMVYYPDHRLRAREFYPKGRVYTVRKEAVPTQIFFRTADNRAAETYSRDFGAQLVSAFREARLGVSHRKAVRPYYYRNGERTLPGVLRYSLVPTSVLVEVANLNNVHDRHAMLDVRSRQRVADAITAALDALRAERTGPIVTRKSS